MSFKNLKLDLGMVDYGGLKTDDDFRREAHRLLPGAIRKLGAAAGEEIAKGLNKSFGMKPSERAKLVREASHNYVKQISARDKQVLEDHIVVSLKEQAAKGIP